MLRQPIKQSIDRTYDKLAQSILNFGKFSSPSSAGASPGLEIFLEFIPQSLVLCELIWELFAYWRIGTWRTFDPNNYTAPCWPYVNKTDAWDPRVSRVYRAHSGGPTTQNHDRIVWRPLYHRYKKPPPPTLNLNPVKTDTVRPRQTHCPVSRTPPAFQR